MVLVSVLCCLVLLIVFSALDSMIVLSSLVLSCLVIPLGLLVVVLFVLVLFGLSLSSLVRSMSLLGSCFVRLRSLCCLHLFLSCLLHWSDLVSSLVVYCVVWTIALSSLLLFGLLLFGHPACLLVFDLFILVLYFKK